MFSGKFLSIVHRIPLLQCTHPFTRLFQVYELELVITLFADQDFSHKVDGLLRILHAKLANRAKYFDLAFLMPRPPCSFGLVIGSQLIKCIFLFSSMLPQVKSLWILSLVLRVLSGSSDNCIIWLGKVLSTEEAYVLLLAILSHLTFQLFSLNLIISIRNW